MSLPIYDTSTVGSKVTSNTLVLVDLVFSKYTVYQTFELIVTLLFFINELLVCAKILSVMVFAKIANINNNIVPDIIIKR